jgi:Tfp pilus assembly protein PilO
MVVNKKLTKQVLIDKADTRMLVFAGIAAFTFVFALFSGKSLISELTYQSRLSDVKQTALTQLQTDKFAETSLVDSYQTFIGSTTNIIGGTSSGSGTNSGNNGQIVLDALPSKYDFPAMLTSVNNLLSTSGVQIVSISGTDNQLTQQAFQTSSTPTPIPMLFNFVVDGSYQNIQNLFNTFQNSIRPFQFKTVSISAASASSGSSGGLTLSATVQTYYQPEKIFSVTSEVVQ